MNLRSRIVWTGVACALACACSGRPVARDTRTPPVVVPSAAHASTPPSPGGSPHAPSAQSVSATVLETMDASNYTYVRVRSDAGELWAAASRFKVAVGDRVVVSLEQPMENFHSQALNRDFPRIYFVSQIAREGEQSPAAAPASVEPATGGMTIAAVWKTRASLAGKNITVRGKVVKFNGGILGVNWIHLQDGSGAADDGTNDITVTSEMDARVGDVITATGIVALNKDLGSGYKYPVIIEHAKIAAAADAREDVRR
jgi:hypothetical protein